MKLKRAWITLSLALALLVPQLARADDQHLPGFIYTFAGNGQKGYGGDGGDALFAVLASPRDPAVGANGTVFFADLLNHRVRKVTPDGRIFTVAGTGVRGFSGDGGPATQAQLNFPISVALDSSGHLYIGDTSNYRIRRVDASSGVISTVAGNGTRGFSGDGGPALLASVDGPRGLTFDSSGNLVFSDFFNARIRRVDLVSQVITTVAGTSGPGSGDGVSATISALNFPADVAFDKEGNLYIADSMNYRVRRVDINGIIETVVGNGQRYGSCIESMPVPVPPYVIPQVCPPIGANGDGFTARETSLMPATLAFSPSGDLYIGTAGPYVKVWDRSTNRVFTISGTGQEAFAGDGGPAKLASFTSMTGMAMMGNDLLVADSGANRIRIIQDDVAWGSN